MDAAYDIAHNIVTLKYEDIPPEVVETTKKEILDILGVISAASTMGQGSKEIVKLVKESGARGKSTIIGHGGRVPSWMAGFANGSMGHELDYGDAPHVSSCTVPTAFAVSEEVSGINGKEFITAVALAVDLHLRLKAAIKEDEANVRTRWLEDLVLGYFTSTAAAGRILGLSEDQIQDSLGHTLQQAAGSRQWQYSAGDVFRGIRDGFPNMGGILSALMAKRGLTGTKESLEGKAGLYNLYFNGLYDRAALVDNLGKKFMNTRISFKPWPCSGAAMIPLYAVLLILNENDILSEEIQEINIYVSEFDEQPKAQIATLEERRNPQTIIDAKFSIPFSIGIAALRKKVVISDFSPEGIKNPDVLKMARRVNLKIDPRISKRTREKIVEIKTKNGKTYQQSVEIPYGDYRKPIAKKDLIVKFKDCVSYSARNISKSKVDQVIGMVNELEKVEDVSQIIRLLG